MRDSATLMQYKSLPLEVKEMMSKRRISEWYTYFSGKVYCSFSGGKDSTVMAHLVHSVYPDVPLVFVNTGLEYLEIQAFAKKMGAVIVYPKVSFEEVLTKYGYPLISKEVGLTIYYARRNKDNKKQTLKGRNELLDKRMNGEGKSIFNKAKWLALSQETQFKISSECCGIIKESPIRKYQRKNKLAPYVGILAEESLRRVQGWYKSGCNAFEGVKKRSWPMSFWTEQDVLQYIRKYNLEICSVYGEVLAVDDSDMFYDPIPGIPCKLKCTGCQRTGCIFCGFGFHLEKTGETRFQLLAKTHPRQYEYCMEGGQWVDNPEYDPALPKYDGDWLNWNPKQIWVPSKKGLGMKKVFDDCNQIYGKDFYRYE